MASPVDASRIATNIATAATSHNINVGSPAAGDLLIIFINTRTASNPITTAPGYTILVNTYNVNSGGVAILYRWADGTEGATDTITTPSIKLGAICWRITGAADPATQAPELSTVLGGSATTANIANTGSVAPTGGSKDYLFLSLVCLSGEGTAATAPPAGYSSLVTANSGTGGATSTNCTPSGASKQATAASEDPGAFTHPVTQQGWLGYTLAIHPAGPGTIDLAATVAGDAAVAVQADRSRNVDGSVAGASAVTEALAVGRTLAASVVGEIDVSADVTVTKAAVEFDIEITTNQPYAGVYDCGEFTCGVGSILAVDLVTVSLDFLDGLIAGQATVGASLTRTRDSIATVAGLGAVTAAQSPLRGVAASVAGTGAVTAQALVTRGLAAAILGTGSVAADTEVVGGETIEFGCTVVGASAVSTTVTPFRNLAASVAGVAAVTPALGRILQIPVAVAGVAGVTAQQGIGRGLAASVSGQASVAADIIRVPVTVQLAALLAGTGDVSPSMTVTNASFINVDAVVAGQAAVSVSLAVSKPLAASVTGSSAVVAQEAPLRGFVGGTVGQAAVAADAVRTRGLGTTVSGSSSVAPSLTVTPPVALAASVAGAASVTSDLTVSGPVGSTITFDAAISRAASVSADIIRVPVTVTFGCTVARAATVAVQSSKTTGLAISISRTGAVSADLITSSIVSLACEIRLVDAICGQFLCGQGTCGGSGPRANINASYVIGVGLGVQIARQAVVTSLLLPSTSFASAIQGQALINALLRPSTSLAAAVAGRAQVSSLLALRLSLAIPISGKATVTAKIGLGWLYPTDPGGILLDPTVEVDWILIPTTLNDVVLVPTAAGTVTLDPTDEEDVLLVPTTERTM